MTILFIILSSYLHFPTFLMFILAMLGLVIDIQEFIEDNEFAKFFDA